MLFKQFGGLNSVSLLGKSNTASSPMLHHLASPVHDLRFVYILYTFTQLSDSDT